MALIKEYFDLTKKYQESYGENTVLLMQVGSFFEVYGIFCKNTGSLFGSKIIDFSQMCDLNIVEKSNVFIESNQIMMAGFKDMQIEKYIKKIQDSSYTAVVYVQDAAAKNTTRSLAGIFSPGTYFHTESQSLTNSITCIWIELVENKVLLKGKYVIVGVANIDIYTGKTTMFQFKEVYMNNPTTYDELERFISIYNPSEAIIISNFPDEKELDYVISYAGISCSLIHKINISINTNILSSEKLKRVKNCEKQIYQKEVLNKFYNFEDSSLFIESIYENNIATQAFCFLLDFVYQHNPHLLNKILEPTFENCSNRLVLANHSLKQLNIIDDGNVKTSKYSSVSNMLNDCLTPMGKRKFTHQFLNPINDVNDLQCEYDIIEYFLNVYNDHSAFLKSNLSTLKDISKWERQIFLKKITPKSFYHLYTNMETLQHIFNKISNDATIMEYLNKKESNILKVYDFCESVKETIKNNIKLDLAKDLDQLQNFEINFIEKDVDINLDKKTKILKESELKLESIQNYLSSVIENTEKKGKKISSDYVKIHETEKNSFSLICTSRRCKLLQESLPNDCSIVSLEYIDDSINKNIFNLKVSKTQFNFEKQSSSNNFIKDQQITELCKNITSSKVAMKDLIHSVYNKFISKMEQFQKEFEIIIEFATLIDLLFTKASIAKKYNYCKPTIVPSEKSFIEVKQLRHCLIERFQTNELYINNDISLGDCKTDGILLYGTNAVGKTSFIKSIGISIIMAQAGLYVPATTFNFYPYSHIFTRIIGNDNIFKGLSTFAVEMSELRTILRLANENSLILGDELCSGTEILSAISIFVSGIQKLQNSKSSFIFATHLHEIVDYEEITNLSTIALKHMEVIYDKETDTLVYDRKLRDGPGNNMYGLEVCKSLNLPKDFLDNAYEIRMKYNPESGSILSLKSSSYNSKKIVNICERCKKKQGKEVHHLNYQKDADDNGIILANDTIFHKNDLGNLMTLCESCHNDIHKKNEHLKKVKTLKGMKIQSI
jgi:DNA mismatch repair protein MutS